MRAAKRSILRACSARVDTGFAFGHAAWSIVLILIAEQRERTRGPLMQFEPAQTRLLAAMRDPGHHRVHLLHDGGAFVPIGLVGNNYRKPTIACPRPLAHTPPAAVQGCKRVRQTPAPP